ncbi:MAG: hypothetical protein K1060chlam1_01113 [Candidatus Anoxychlamydiales bacterium]|nr:hypothetical protein [Candidatus Anoxychlamydiales bacterium]
MFTVDARLKRLEGLERLDTEDIFQATYRKHMKKPLISKIAILVYDIFSVLIFPIAICRYIHYKVHVFLGYYLFVPAQFLSKKDKKKDYSDESIKPEEDVKEVKQKKYIREGRQNLKKVFNAQIVNIKTADGAKLNGVFVPGEDALGRTLRQNGPLIIFFLGQTGMYEDLGKGRFQEVLKNIRNHNVLVFNERGVLKSSSIATRKGLYLDAEAILQFAKKRLKVPKEKIVLHGHSFGGVKATYLASKHREIKLLNDRSFGSSDKAIYYMAKDMFHKVFSVCFLMPLYLIEKFASQNISNKVKNFLKRYEISKDYKLLRPIFLVKMIRAATSVAAFICAKITVIFGWKLTPEKDWQKVKDKKFILFLRDDETIPYEASFFKAVKKKEKQFIRILDPNCIHWTAMAPDIYSVALKALEA